MPNYTKRNDYTRIYVNSTMTNKTIVDERYEAALAQKTATDKALHQQIATIIVSEGLLRTDEWYVNFDVTQINQQIRLNCGLEPSSIRDGRKDLFDLMMNDALLTNNSYGINYYKVKSPEFNFSLCCCADEKDPSDYSYATIIILDENKLAETLRTLGIETKVNTCEFTDHTIESIEDQRSKLYEKYMKFSKRLDWFNSLPKLKKTQTGEES